MMNFGAMDPAMAALYQQQAYGLAVAQDPHAAMMQAQLAAQQQAAAYPPPGVAGGYGARAVPGGAAKGMGKAAGYGARAISTAVKAEPQAIANRAMGADISQADDAIYTATGTALKDLSAEDETDLEALKWKITKYFRNAAKGIDWSKGEFHERINEFADTAFGTLMWVLNDRKWMRDADFTIVLEVAVHELFPEEQRAGIGAADLEDAILKAHDRSFEEKRAAPMLWDAVQTLVEGKKAQNKVYNAAEAGRKEAMEVQGPALEFAANHVDEDIQFSGPFWDKIKEFMAGWVHGTIKKVFTENAEYVTDFLPEDKCLAFFQQLCDDMALPRTMMLDLGMPIPQPWGYLKHAVSSAYKRYQPEPEPPKPKKQKVFKEPAGFKEELCWYFAAGHCQFGKGCCSAHGELELRGKGLFMPQEIPIFKTELCRFFKAGSCKFGAKCMSAHGRHELVQKPHPSEAPMTMPEDFLGEDEMPTGFDHRDEGYKGGPIRPLPKGKGKDFGGKDFGGKGKFGGKDFGGKDFGGKDFGGKGFGGKDFGGKDFGGGFGGGKAFGGKDFGKGKGKCGGGMLGPSNLKGAKAPRPVYGMGKGGKAIQVQPAIDQEFAEEEMAFDTGFEDTFEHEEMLGELETLVGVEGEDMTALDELAGDFDPSVVEEEFADEQDVMVEEEPEVRAPVVLHLPPSRPAMPSSGYGARVPGGAGKYGAKGGPSAPIPFMGGKGGKMGGNAAPAMRTRANYGRPS